MRITKALTFTKMLTWQKRLQGWGANVLYLSPGNKDKPILAPGGWIKCPILKPERMPFDEIELIAQDIKSITKWIRILAVLR